VAQYHRKLNSLQQEILLLLYTFRFAARQLIVKRNFYLYKLYAYVVQSKVPT
jgi:hypothetical protein